MNMETVLITGGTGTIGTALTTLLTANNYKVIILTRKKRADTQNVSYSQWDVTRNTIDKSAIERSDHIIHLAGEGVADKRWTEKRKQQIVNSRVDSAALLVKSLKDLPNQVKTVVSASAIGWYGTDKNRSRPFIESDHPSNDFLGATCKRWEETMLPVQTMGKRLVILRTGIVLAKEGGAFPEFEKPIKAAVAAILGDGNQVISWIHIDDLCRMYMAAIQMKHLQGIYNAVAPDPVTNKELVLTIARMRKRPFIAVHIPAFVLKIMLGELSIEVLKSAVVDGSKIRNAGFNFTFPAVDAAVNDLLHTNDYR